MSSVAGAGAQSTQSYLSAQDNAQASNRFVQWLNKERESKRGLSMRDFENRLTELLFKDMRTGLGKAEALVVLKEFSDFTERYPHFLSYNHTLMRIYMQNVLSNDLDLPFSFLEEMFLLLINSNLMNDRDLTEFKECCWTWLLPEEYWPYLEKPKTQTAKPTQFSYYPAVSIPNYSAPRIVQTQEPVTAKLDHFEIFFNKKLLGFLDGCKILFKHLPLTDHELRICNDQGETTVGKLETVFTALLQVSSRPEFKVKMDKAADPVELKKEYEERRATIAQLAEQLKSKLSKSKS